MTSPRAQQARLSPSCLLKKNRLLLFLRVQLPRRIRKPASCRNVSSSSVGIVEVSFEQLPMSLRRKHKVEHGELFCHFSPPLVVY